MNGLASRLGKKTFSLTLILNSFLTITCLTELLYGFYRALPYWRPFWPYLVDGNLLWLLILTALLNIYPSASIGRSLHIGRFLFHHYFYGILVILLACIFIVFFTQIPLPSLFLLDTNNMAVYVGRFFVLGGLTLLLDDLPDVSKRGESCLNWLKSKVYKARKIVSGVHLVCTAASFYISFAVIIWAIQNHDSAISNVFIFVTGLITSLTALILLKRKAWLNMNQ